MAKRGRPPKNKAADPAVKPKPVLTMVKLIAGMHAYEKPVCLRTGVHAIDLVLGDGVPRGRYIELLGDPATAKSAFGYAIIATFQRAGGVAFLIDPESKTDQSFAEKFGVDWSKLGYPGGDAPEDMLTLENIVKLIARIADTADSKIPTVIVWDSIAATPGAEELEEDFDPAKPEMMKRARILSASFRSVMNRLHHKGITLIGVNQLRQQLVRSFSFKEAPGGRALRYHASARLMFRKTAIIKSAKTSLVTGIELEIEAVKNTLAPPYRKAKMRFKFDSGFDTYSGLKEFLVRHGRLTLEDGQMKFGSYAFKDFDWNKVVMDHPELLAPIRGVVESVVAGSGGEIVAGEAETQEN